VPQWHALFMPLPIFRRQAILHFLRQRQPLYLAQNR
jgi:hypothetical protein